MSAFTARLEALQRLLMALRETQVEQGQRLDSLERRLDSLEQVMLGRFATLEQEMRGGFAMLAVGQAEILALLRRDDSSG